MHDGRFSYVNTESDASPTCPFVCSFLGYQSGEHNMSKTNEPILMPTSTRSSRDKGMKRSTLGSGGQRSRSHEAEDSFGGLAEALFQSQLHLDRVALLCVLVFSSLFLFKNALFSV